MGGVNMRPARGRGMANQRGGAALLLAAFLVFFTQLGDPPDLRAALMQAASAFAPMEDSAARVELSMPARCWYLVDSDGAPVAACDTLLEAELARASYGALASVRTLETEAVSLNVTATRAQREALQNGLAALLRTLDTRAPAPQKTADALGRALLGTENAVARGLAGLVLSAADAQTDFITLAMQYAAFVSYLAQ